VVSIPNTAFADMQLENFTRRDRILLRTTINLRYETTDDQLRYVLAEIRRLLIAHPKIHPDPARARFVGFGAHSLDIELYAYVCTSDFNEFLAVREDVFLRIMKLVLDSGTGFAFPSQINYLARDSGVNSALRKQAEASVASWRGDSQLPFPEFSPSEVDKLRGRLDYPPKGSPDLATDQSQVRAA
jgi:MscS family membrane protein